MRQPHNYMKEIIKLIKSSLIGTGLATILLVGFFSFMVTSSESNFNKAYDIIDQGYINILNNFAEKYNEEIREESIDFTRECKWIDDACFVEKIFNELKNVSYRYTWSHDEYLQSPSFTRKIMAGDCKALSMLVCGYLNNVGKDCKIVCSDVHCWSEIYSKINNMTYVVDLTVPIWYAK